MVFTTQRADPRVPQIVDGVRRLLPPIATWDSLDEYGYRSLALCVIDSIQSIGVNYGSVERVVRRFRELQQDAGLDTAEAGTSALVASFDRVGGAERWAISVQNMHRAWSRRTAPLKAEVILSAAELLLEHGIDTLGDLHTCRQQDPTRWGTLRSGWLSLPGQSRGTSWRYMLMLAGVPGVKPDRMIGRFVAACTGRSIPPPDELADLVVLAADDLKVSASVLDHAIWRYQSGRKPRVKVISLEPPGAGSATDRQ
jgi:hypothetical protein